MQKVSLAFDPEQQASNVATKTHEFEQYYSKRNNTWIGGVEGTVGKLIHFSVDYEHGKVSWYIDVMYDIYVIVKKRMQDIHSHRSNELFHVLGFISRKHTNKSVDFKCETNQLSPWHEGHGS